MKRSSIIVGGAMAACVAFAATGVARADWDGGPSFSIGIAGPPAYYAPPPPPVYYAPPPPGYYPPPPPPGYYPPPPPAYYAPSFPAGLSFGFSLPLGGDDDH